MFARTRTLMRNQQEVIGYAQRLIRKLEKINKCMGADKKFPNTKKVFESRWYVVCKVDLVGSKSLANFTVILIGLTCNFLLSFRTHLV